MSRGVRAGDSEKGPAPTRPSPRSMAGVLGDAHDPPSQRVVPMPPDSTARLDETDWKALPGVASGG